MSDVLNFNSNSDVHVDFVYKNETETIQVKLQSINDVVDGIESSIVNELSLLEKYGADSTILKDTDKKRYYSTAQQSDIRIFEGVSVGFVVSLDLLEENEDMICRYGTKVNAFDGMTAEQTGLMTDFNSLRTSMQSTLYDILSFADSQQLYMDNEGVPDDATIQKLHKYIELVEVEKKKLYGEQNFSFLNELNGTSITNDLFIKKFKDYTTDRKNYLENKQKILAQSGYLSAIYKNNADNLGGESPNKNMVGMGYISLNDYNVVKKIEDYAQQLGSNIAIGSIIGLAASGLANTAIPTSEVETFVQKITSLSTWFEAETSNVIGTEISNQLALKMSEKQADFEYVSGFLNTHAASVSDSLSSEQQASMGLIGHAVGTLANAAGIALGASGVTGIAIGAAITILASGMVRYIELQKSEEDGLNALNHIVSQDINFDDPQSFMNFIAPSRDHEINGKLNQGFDNAIADSSVRNVIEGNNNDNNIKVIDGNNNVITGLGGNDTLIGYELADKLVGGIGSDVLNGGAGNDLLVGGSQRDEYHFSLGHGHDVIEEEAEQLTGGVEGDIKLDDSIVGFELHRQLQDLKIVTGNQSSIVVLDYFASDIVSGGGELSQQQSDMKINGQLISDVLKENTEFRTIRGTNEGDILIAETRNTLFDDTDHGYSLLGYEGDDTLLGGTNSDLLNGGTGSDTYIINALGSADTIIDKSGACDRVVVNADFDSYELFKDDTAIVLKLFTTMTLNMIEIKKESNVIRFEQCYYDDESDETVNQKLNEDIVEYIEFKNGNILDIHSLASSLLVQEQTNEQSIEVEVLKGTNWGDEYVFDRNGKSLVIHDYQIDKTDSTYTIANAGVDSLRIVGYVPNELYVERSVDEPKDLIIRSIYQKYHFVCIKNYFHENGPIIEMIQFDDGELLKSSDLIRVLDSQTGRIAVSLNAPHMLQGSRVAEEIYGSNTKDSIMGGRGDDYLNGRYGSDTYIYNSGDGNDRIEDKSWFTGEIDTLYFKDIKMEEVIFSSANNGRDLLIEIRETGERITVINGLRYSFNRLEQIVFSDGSIIEGDQAKDLMINLEVCGTSGDDELSGGSAASGHDLLIGKEGDDKLYGYAGADSYVYRKGDGDDWIYDHYGSNDQIDKLYFEDITLSELSFRSGDNGNDLLIDVCNGQNTITIQDGLKNDYNRIEMLEFDDGTIVAGEEMRDRTLHLEVVGTSTDDVLTGGNADDGHDILFGKDGDDKLYGFKGSDTYVYRKGDGDDQIYEKDGSSEQTDKLYFEDMTIEELSFRSDDRGDDLVIDICNGQNTITVIDGLRNKSSRIEKIVFADGTEIAGEDIWDRLLHLEINGTDADEVLMGGNAEDGRDLIFGKKGNDNLYGYGGSDTYVYRKGDGNDRIYEFGVPEGQTDKVHFEDVSFDDLKFKAGGRGQDLIIDMFNGQSTITIDNGISNNYCRIEALEFANEPNVDGDQLEALMLNLNIVGTSQADVLIGGDTKDGYDYFLGGESDDVMYGYRGDDIYHFKRGHGSDKIFDTAYYQNKDKIIIDDYELSDLSFRTDKYSNDMIIEFQDSSDRLTVDYGLRSRYNRVELLEIGDVLYNVNLLLQAMGEYCITEGISKSETLVEESGIKLAQITKYADQFGYNVYEQ